MVKAGKGLWAKREEQRMGGVTKSALKKANPHGSKPCKIGHLSRVSSLPMKQTLTTKPAKDRMRDSVASTRQVKCCNHDYLEREAIGGYS